MCYHSLSQSIKSEFESTTNFKDFVPPYSDINVWIDHGFQPYNFTLYEKNGISSRDYENQLITKKIDTLWNYIDSGTATKGIINQLNASQFTLGSFYKGIQNFSFKIKIVLLFKNIIFHYDNDEKRIRNYIDTLTHLKLLVKKRKLSSLFQFFQNAIPLLKPILKIIFFWNREKDKFYKVSKYAPLVFKHTIFEKEFYVFQTLEMVDFKKALAKENIDLLVKESGIFIAHTYFSVDRKHYSGKLFLSEGKFDAEVVNNFEYLGKLILENRIWNPTLSELIAYFKFSNETIISVNDHGKFFVKSNFNISSRIIK